MKIYFCTKPITNNYIVALNLPNTVNFVKSMQNTHFLTILDPVAFINFFLNFNLRILYMIDIYKLFLKKAKKLKNPQKNHNVFRYTKLQFIKSI